MGQNINRAYHPKHTIFMVKHSGGIIVVDICFSSARTRNLARVTGKIKRDEYKPVLEDNLAKAEQHLKQVQRDYEEWSNGGPDQQQSNNL